MDGYFTVMGVYSNSKDYDRFTGCYTVYSSGFRSFVPTSVQIDSYLKYLIDSIAAGFNVKNCRSALNIIIDTYFPDRRPIFSEVVSDINK